MTKTGAVEISVNETEDFVYDLEIHRLDWTPWLCGVKKTMVLWVELYIILYRIIGDGTCWLELWMKSGQRDYLLDIKNRFYICSIMISSKLIILYYTPFTGLTWTLLLGLFPGSVYFLEINYTCIFQAQLGRFYNV